VLAEVARQLDYTNRAMRACGYFPQGLERAVGRAVIDKEHLPWTAAASHYRFKPGPQSGQVCRLVVDRNDNRNRRRRGSLSIMKRGDFAR
jgi:hypothetical protein